MWRYIDLEGAVQGPFTANQMIGWYEKGHLVGKLDLQMCGTVSHFTTTTLPPLPVSSRDDRLGEKAQLVGKLHAPPA